MDELRPRPPKEEGPVNRGRPVREVYAYIADAGGGDEGIVAFQQNGIWVPMVTSSREDAEAHMDVARRVARETQRPVRLVMFSNRTDLKVIPPVFLGPRQG